jgi:hypothetical protein
MVAKRIAMPGEGQRIGDGVGLGPPAGSSGLVKDGKFHGVAKGRLAKLQM